METIYLQRERETTMNRKRVSIKLERLDIKPDEKVIYKNGSIYVKDKSKFCCNKNVISNCSDQYVVYNKLTYKKYSSRKKIPEKSIMEDHYLKHTLNSGTVKQTIRNCGFKVTNTKTCRNKANQYLENETQIASSKHKITQEKKGLLKQLVNNSKTCVNGFQQWDDLMEDGMKTNKFLNIGNYKLQNGIAGPLRHASKEFKQQEEPKDTDKGMNTTTFYKSSPNKTNSIVSKHRYTKKVFLEYPIVHQIPNNNSSFCAFDLNPCSVVLEDCMKPVTSRSIETNFKVNTDLTLSPKRVNTKCNLILETCKPQSFKWDHEKLQKSRNIDCQQEHNTSQIKNENKVSSMRLRSSYQCPEDKTKNFLLGKQKHIFNISKKEFLFNLGLKSKNLLRENLEDGRSYVFNGTVNGFSSNCTVVINKLKISQKK